MKPVIVTFIVSFCLLASFRSLPAFDNESIDKQRSDLMKRWGGEGIIKPKDVDIKATALFALPISQQSETELLRVAKNANFVANLVDIVTDRYEVYHNKNSRYDWILKQFGPYYNPLTKVSNRMRKYRNLAYFNLGKLALSKGKRIMALFYFRDAFRLSVFETYDNNGEGIRFYAEEEIKKLLGMEDVPSWKKATTDYIMDGIPSQQELKEKLKDIERKIQKMKDTPSWKRWNVNSSEDKFR